MNPRDTPDFMECESCAAKPGSPLLCRSCLSNRTVINTLRTQRDLFIKKHSKARLYSDMTTLIVAGLFLVPLLIVLWKWALS